MQGQVSAGLQTKVSVVVMCKQGAVCVAAQLKVQAMHGVCIDALVRNVLLSVQCINIQTLHLLAVTPAP